MKNSGLLAALVVTVSLVPMIWISMELQNSDEVGEHNFQQLLSERIGGSPNDLSPSNFIVSLPNPSGDCPRTRTLDWNSLDRNDRFPSVDERVCLYMTRWYDPHYQTSKQWKPTLTAIPVDELTVDIFWDKSFLYTMAMEPNLLMNDVPFFLYPHYNMSLMEKWGDQKNWIMFVFYSGETSKFCSYFSNNRTDAATAVYRNHPALFSWGDQEMHIDVQLPIAAKWRFNDLSHHTRPVPILVPMEGAKHYGPLKQVKENDVAWSDKKDEAIWRGDMSGVINGKFHQDYEYGNKTHETCMDFPRCRLVYHNQNTTMANIGFATCQQEDLKQINGVNMMRPKEPMKEQLTYKMLISVEGNDVATGLKWNLLSNSVVLMPPPLKSIFSMEFLLEPYIHYVPLDVDNVETAIQWVLDNDSEAHGIAQRATNFINDLFLHPDAEKDNDAVLQQMADRISAFWE